MPKSNEKSPADLTFVKKNIWTVRRSRGILRELTQKEPEHAHRNAPNLDKYQTQDFLAKTVLTKLYRRCFYHFESK